MTPQGVVLPFPNRMADREPWVTKSQVAKRYHKARTAATSLPMKDRSDSKVWLAMRGMQSMDDGDVPWGTGDDDFVGPK